VISHLGGWHTLAQTHPWETTTFDITTEQSAKRFRWSSMTMGPNTFLTNYGSCVNVVVAEDGLGMSVALLFRAVHPPIFIPLNAVDTCEQGRVFWKFRRTAIVLKDWPHPLCFSGQCAAEIEVAWKRANGVAADNLQA
jgi:hypothetical protein